MYLHINITEKTKQFLKALAHIVPFLTGRVELCVAIKKLRLLQKEMSLRT